MWNVYASSVSALAGRSVLMAHLRPVSSSRIALSGASAPTQSYEKLKALLREVDALSEIQGILGYDEQVFMPPGAAASRAKQKGALAKILHDKSTGTEMREAIDGVRGREEDFDDVRVRANIRDAVDAFDKEARKSSELAQKEAQLESEANQAWAAARKASDFSLFAGKLTEIFELKKEVAAVTRPALKSEPYDGALDAFECGMLDAGKENTPSYPPHTALPASSRLSSCRCALPLPGAACAQSASTRSSRSFARAWCRCSRRSTPRRPRLRLPTRDDPRFPGRSRGCPRL